MTERCEFSDLIAWQCACTRCRPDVVAVLLDAGPVSPGRGALLDEPRFERVGRRFEATWPGNCANEECGARIHPGSMIARTTDGDYVCGGCAA